MKSNKNLIRIFLMVITLPKGKKEIIGDILEKYQVVGFASTLAKGAIDKSFTKDVMFCVIREDQAKDAILKLEDKFKSFRSNVCMAYTIPIDSIIGVSNYLSLTSGGVK